MELIEQDEEQLFSELKETDVAKARSDYVKKITMIVDTWKQKKLKARLKQQAQEQVFSEEQ